ncbi:MAG: polyhydroxyalkanoate depolymerase [Betaproteobacteria bacterium]
MLYALHEMQHAMLAPWVSFAEASLSLYTSPFSALSYLPHSQRLAAGSELMLRVTQRYSKPLWQIEDTVVGGKTVAVSPVAALEKPFCKLIHFERALKTRRQDPKILLVAPLSGHHATLLRDTVRTMLPEHDVYVTDWVDARMVPVTEGAFHLDDYVDYVREFVRFIGEGVHVISVCQPTVPVLAAISLIAQHDEAVKPRSMTMMGGPIDARKSPTAVNNLALEKPLSWFKRSVIQRVPLKYPGYMRQVYPGFLQHTGFVAMNPSRHADAHRDFYNHLVQGDGDSAAAHRKFYDEYNAVLDMPAEYYIDTIKTVFQEFALPKGRMFVREELVRPAAITKTALLTIEGEFDDISGNGQTAAAHELCTKIPARMKDHFLVPKVGHYGIFSGRRWREVIYPHIHAFIRKHA